MFLIFFVLTFFFFFQTLSTFLERKTSFASLSIFVLSIFTYRLNCIVMLCCKGTSTKDSPESYGKNAQDKEGGNPKDWDSSNRFQGGKKKTSVPFLKSTITEAENFIDRLKGTDNKADIKNLFLSSLGAYAIKGLELSWEEYGKVLEDVLKLGKSQSAERSFRQSDLHPKEGKVDSFFYSIIAQWGSCTMVQKGRITEKGIVSILEGLRIYCNVSKVLKDEASTKGKKNEIPRKSMVQEVEYDLLSTLPPLFVNSDLQVYQKKRTLSFYHVLWFCFQSIARSRKTYQLFLEYSRRSPVMSPARYWSFLSEGRNAHITEKEGKEHMARCGELVYPFNFIWNTRRLETNSALKTANISEVYHNMGQPFPQYSICCAVVDSEESLEKALVRRSVRGFVLSPLKRINASLNEESGSGLRPTSLLPHQNDSALVKSPPCISPARSYDFQSGSCSLTTIIKQIKERGFKGNSNPVILCLPSLRNMSHEDQVLLAKLLKEELKDFLEKGLMMKWIHATDPKFTPRSYSNKVLLMGEQGKLLPYIGCWVADVARKNTGVRVVEVEEGGPAATGCICPGVWLTHVNDKVIEDKNFLKREVQSAPFGSALRLKREGLYDIRITVGGRADDSNTDACSELVKHGASGTATLGNNGFSSWVAKEISELIFFKYTDEREKNQPSKPWETCVISSSGLLKENATRNGKEMESSENQSSMKTDFEYSNLAMKSKESFFMVRIEGKNENPEQIKNLLSAASHCGVQFVIVDNHPSCLAWSKGRFMDNGGCGYLLKDINDSDEKSPTSLKTTFQTTIEVLEGPQAIGYPLPKTMEAGLIGEGKMQKRDTNKVEFGDFLQSSVCYLRLTFEDSKRDGESMGNTTKTTDVFTTAFPLGLCHPGYRVLPCYRENQETLSEEGGEDEILVLVKHYSL